MSIINTDLQNRSGESPLYEIWNTRSPGILVRLRTNQNLATELDLAIVAKRSFKNCVYFIYVLLNLNIVKKLQANTWLKLLTTLNILCKHHFWENPEKKFLQKKKKHHFCLLQKMRIHKTINS